MFVDPIFLGPILFQLISGLVQSGSEGFRREAEQRSELRRLLDVPVQLLVI